MLDVKQEGQNAGLAEQESSSIAQEEKESLWTLEASTSDKGGLQKCCVPGRRKVVWPKLGVEAGQYCGGQQKGLFKVCQHQKRDYK